MLKRSYRRWMTLVASGAMLLQAVSCTETVSRLAEVSQIITAGGVIWLVRKVME